MNLRSTVQRLFIQAARGLQPKPDPQATRIITAPATAEAEQAARHRAAYVERSMELIEARTMAGSGPWLVAEARGAMDKPGRFKESNPIVSAGAYGDIELALSNVEWRREVNLSWIEFSRWGMQQIILIARLYYMKNPIIRRLIDVCAAYVFARGVDVSSPNPRAQEVLKAFFEANKAVLGQLALVDLERRKDYDGNLFFVFFTDRLAKGSVKVRTIDATEIMDVICNPDDTDEPWYYRRVWVQRNFDPASGQISTDQMECWYPALNFRPLARPEQLNGLDVRWDSPVFHRKCGAVSKWHFGAPRIYPALDWSKSAKEFLENCATVQKSLAQISRTIESKGGQQALEGIKQQLQTNVNAQPGNSLWDTNPTPVSASIFASGPGTKIEAFQTRGAGADPEEVRQFKLMCCMVKGVPETFLGDVSTGNLATATSLDRPTETMFLELQEAWIEDLGTFAKFVLESSLGASGGRLREAFAGQPIEGVEVRPMRREKNLAGKWRYFPLAEAENPGGKIVEVRVEFPAIREGDIPELVKATVMAMTLDNKGGQVVGIDAKEGVRHLGDLLGIAANDEIIEEMYPDSEYERERSKIDLPAPIPKLLDQPGGAPAETPEGNMKKAAEALRAAAAAL